MNSKRFIAVFLACILLATTSLAKIPDDLPYEAHSFNELAYWRQMLVKNVKWFKMDLTFATRESCLEYSNWDSSLNDCMIEEDLEVCCLALKGDTSPMPWQTNHFEHSYNFLDFMASPNNVKFFQAETQIVVAIFFPSDIIGVQPLITDFMYTFARVIKEYKLNLTLLGMGSYVKNLNAKCEAGQCSDEETLVYDFKFNLGDDLLDLGWRNIPDQCKTGFPETPLSYRFVEPSDQNEIQTALSEFMDPSCKKAKGMTDVTAVRVTCNQEPEMFQVYAAPYLNDEFLKGANKQLHNDSVRAFNQIKQDSDVLVSLRIDSSQKNHLELHSLKIGQIPSNTKSMAIGNGLGTASGMSLSGDLTLVQYDSDFEIYQITSDSEAKLIKSVKHNKTLYAAELVKLEKDTHVAMITVGDDKLMHLELAQLDLIQGTITDIASASIDMGFKPENLRGVAIGAITDPKDSTKLTASVTISNLDVEQDIPKLYFAEGSIDKAAAKIDVKLHKKHFDYGAHPSLELIADGSESYILEMHTDGLCQCGSGLNNLGTDNCSISSSEESFLMALQSVKGKINYNWGRLGHFTSELGYENMMDACNTRIMHAKVTSGLYPSVDLYKVSDDELKVVFLNINVDDLAFLDKMTCGLTTNTDEPGVYINSFDILSFDDLMNL